MFSFGMEVYVEIDKCAKCGAEMTCGISQGKETCWCYEKPKVLKYDSNYPGCFCPKCLDEEILKVSSLRER